MLERQGLAYTRLFWGWRPRPSAPGRLPSEKKSPPTQYTPSETFSGLHTHKQIKSTPFSKANIYQAYIKSELEPTPDPLAYWNSLYFSQPDLARFALNILAIPLISAKCKCVFSFVKYLIINFYNCLKANIIEVNKCLKSWFGRLEPGAFDK